MAPLQVCASCKRSLGKGSHTHGELNLGLSPYIEIFYQFTTQLLENYVKLVLYQCL